MSHREPTDAADEEIARLRSQLSQIAAIIDRRRAWYHGEACALCHGSGSARTCPLPERDPEQSDAEDLLCEIAELTSNEVE